MAQKNTITIPAGERPPLAMLMASDQPWAITPRAIRAMIRAIAHPDFAAAYDAVSGRAGQFIEGGRGAKNHGGTAVLDIHGPLVRYRSIWSWLLGATAVEDAAIGLQAALDDSAVRAIVLDINSPGGQIDGINEFANMIRAANAKKPVTAYVGSLAGSGAYWLASAAGKLVADETAQVGSIGVLATIVDDSAVDEKHGIKRFDIVSSQSPLKRLDPASAEGRDQIQQMVDSLAQIFIAKVAKFRGTTEAAVVSDFGQGAVIHAPAAIEAGMVDALGSMEALLGGQTGDAPIREVRDKPGLRVAAPAIVTGTATTIKAAGDPPEDDEEDDEDDKKAAAEPEPDDEPDEDDEEEKEKAVAAKGEGMTSVEERQRIAAILNCEEAKGRTDLARMLALETETSVDAAKKILAAAPVANQTNSLDARMSALGNPKVGVPGDAQTDDSVGAEVQRVLSYVPKNRLRAHARVQ
jgi:capsid assembly protease